jgi:hypothetical protein
MMVPAVDPAYHLRKHLVSRIPIPLELQDHSQISALEAFPSLAVQAVMLERDLVVLLVKLAAMAVMVEMSMSLEQIT